MFSTKIRTVIASLAVVGSLAAVASPASALTTRATTTTTFHPTTTTTTTAARYESQYFESGTDDAKCTAAANNANSWASEADIRWSNGDLAGAKTAQANADAIAGEANAKGCVVVDRA